MKKTPWLVGAGGALVIGLWAVGVAAAASPAPTGPTPLTPPEVEPATTPLTGTLNTSKDADGDAEFAIGATRISIGPSWFWGAGNPLTGLVGETVTVTGHMDDGAGPTKATTSDTSKTRTPEFEVYTVNGTTVREPGRPAWAGGPKVVGAAHPGSSG